MRLNKNQQMILNEHDVIKSWLSDVNIKEAHFEDVEPINIYNNWCDLFDIDKNIAATTENTTDNFVEQCINNWSMPSEYYHIDIHGYLEDKCETSEQVSRVRYELALYDERGLTIVLKFLRYLVDVCDNNDIVLGVGRGSSVASYCLYLLGIHRVDSLKYDLDIKEFLK